MRRSPGNEGCKLIFRLIFATLLVSLPVILVPLFVLVRAMGMLNSYAGLITPAIFHAFGIFLLRQFYLGIPDELEEAAILDGAGYWRVYANIILPLSRPILAALAVFFFLANWNSFLWPLTITNDPEPLGRADRDRQLPATVRLGPELHHGRLGRRRHADHAPLLHLPAAARRVDQDIGIQVARRVDARGDSAMVLRPVAHSTCVTTRESWCCAYS